MTEEYKLDINVPPSTFKHDRFGNGRLFFDLMLAHRWWREKKVDPSKYEKVTLTQLVEYARDLEQEIRARGFGIPKFNDEMRKTYPNQVDLPLLKSFYPQDKPKFRLMELSDIEQIKTMTLPALIQKKYDGFSAQLQTSGHIYSGRGDSKDHQFKGIIEKQLSTLPDGVYVAEALMYEGDQPLHRSMIIGYADSNKYDPEKEDNCIFEIYDVLFWKGEDVREKPLTARLKLLTQISESKNIKIMHGEDNEIITTMSGLEPAVKKVSKLKGSEGAMIKVLDSPYTIEPQNPYWAKIKKRYEVDSMVVGKHEVTPTTFNYFTVAGPYPKTDVQVILDTAKDKIWEGEDNKWYAHLGGTFNTSVEARMGDIIRISVAEVNVKEYESNGVKAKTYGLFHPKVLSNITDEKQVPDQLSVLDRIAESTLPKLDEPTSKQYNDEECPLKLLVHTVERDSLSCSSNQLNLDVESVESNLTRPTGVKAIEDTVVTSASPVTAKEPLRQGCGEEQPQVKKTIKSFQTRNGFEIIRKDLEDEYRHVAKAGERLPDKFYQFTPKKKQLKWVLDEHKPGKVTGEGQDKPVPEEQFKVPAHGEMGFEKDWSDEAREASLEARRVKGGITGSLAEYSIDGGKGKLDATISGNSAEINTLEVQSSERGKGTGAALLRVSEHRLREAGVREARIRAVPGSEGFWEKQGYSQYLNKPDVSNLSPEEGRAKLEYWRSQMKKPLEKDVNKGEIILKFRDHLDFRMEIQQDGIIWQGYTPHPSQTPSAWEVFQQRMRDHRQVQCAAKSPCEHPRCMEWFSIGKDKWEEIRAGEPGASTIRTGLLKQVAHGTYEFGVQRENLHEYFLKGDLEGRVVFRRLNFGDSIEWYFIYPEDQMPLKPWEHEDSGNWKIIGANPPKKVGVDSDVPSERTTPTEIPIEGENPSPATLTKRDHPEHVESDFQADRFIREFTEDLKAIHDSFTDGNLTKDQAVSHCELLIEALIPRLISSAKRRITRKIQKSVDSLPPEVETRIRRSALEYLEDFKHIIEESEKAST